MKKILLALSFFVLIPVTALAAPERVGKFQAGVGAAALIPTGDGLRAAPAVNGEVSYGVTEWVAVGFSGGWGDSELGDVKTSTDTTIDAGKVTFVPLFGDIIFRANAHCKESLLPYAVVGLGGLIPHSHGDGKLNDNNLYTENNDGFALKLGLGADWFANDDWAFFVEGHYVMTTAEVKVRNRSTTEVTDTVELDYWQIGGGAKYLFS